MAVLDEKKLNESLSKKKLSPFYYFYGPEPMKMDAFVERIRLLLQEKSGENFSWEKFFGDEVNAEQLCDSSDSFSLWQKQKGILVKNAEAIPAKKWENLKKLIDDPNENTTLIFCASKADLRTKHIQWISKATNGAVLVACPEINEWEAGQWIKKFSKDLNKELSPEAVALLLDWSGNSLNELKQSIEKAALYEMGGKIIEADHIRAVHMRTKPESIFNFTDALLARNKKEALLQLTTILDQGEDPIALLGLIVRQYRWMLQILALKAEAKNEASIQTELRLYPRQAKNLFRFLQGQREQTVTQALQALVAADKAMKSSREPPRRVLERLTLQLMQ